jgi:hypothetical protein
MSQVPTSTHSRRKEKHGLMMVELLFFHALTTVDDGEIGSDKC